MRRIRAMGIRDRPVSARSPWQNGYAGEADRPRLGFILRQSRRELLWLGVTAHPNAEWLARALTEACGWDDPPRYLIRDRDGGYGAAFIRRIRDYFSGLRATVPPTTGCGVPLTGKNYLDLADLGEASPG
jgi:hypothetical protein